MYSSLIVAGKCQRIRLDVVHQNVLQRNEIAQNVESFDCTSQTCAGGSLLR